MIEPNGVEDVASTEPTRDTTPEKEDGLSDTLSANSAETFSIVREYWSSTVTVLRRRNVQW